MEDVLQPLSPREIQSRVRAGANPDVIAAETGWPLDKVLRYAEPPLQERAFIVERAQQASVRGSGLLFVEFITERSPGATWDAYRGEDSRWYVCVTANGKTSTWIFEPTGRSVTPVEGAGAVDVGAEHVSAVASPETITKESATDVVEEETALPMEMERPHLVSVPDLPSDPDAQAQSVVDAASTDQQSAPTPAAPAKAKRTKRGRASVPKWDEILFGTSRPED